MAAVVEAAEATHPALSSSNPLNDTRINVLASSHLGQKQITISEALLDYCYPYAPNGEGKDSMFQIPSGEGKDSWCTVSQNSQYKNRPGSRGRLRHFLSQWEE